MHNSELKRVFQEGWSHPDRVEGWIGSQLYREFVDAGLRKAWKEALRKAAAGVSSASELTALDIGTGPGTIAEFWAELGFRTTGLDFSPTMLEVARQTAAERRLSITYLDGDAEAPPFPDAGFNVISSRFLLFTLPHPGYAMRRWVQLLRPDGVLVLIGHDYPDRPQGRGHHNDRKRTWRPSEEYREALRQLPFKDHTSGELSVVMEATGLRDIHCIPMDEVAAAREELCLREPDARSLQSTPFVLVGRK